MLFFGILNSGISILLLYDVFQLVHCRSNYKLKLYSSHFTFCMFISSVQCMTSSSSLPARSRFAVLASVLENVDYLLYQKLETEQQNNISIENAEFDVEF